MTGLIVIRGDWYDGGCSAQGSLQYGRYLRRGRARPSWPTDAEELHAVAQSDLVRFRSVGHTVDGGSAGQPKTSSTIAIATPIRAATSAAMVRRRGRWRRVDSVVSWRIS